MKSLRYSGFFRGEPRVIGGVCQGLAQRYGWDVNSLRIAVVVAALFFPIVCALYALAWVFLSLAKDGRIHVDEMLKGNFDAAILLAVCGGGTSGIALGIFHAFVWIPLFLVFPVAIVVIAVLLAKPRQTGTGPTQGQYWSATPPAQPSSQAASSPFTPASPQGEETMPDTTPDWRTQGGPQLRPLCTLLPFRLLPHKQHRHRPLPFRLPSPPVNLNPRPRDKQFHKAQESVSRPLPRSLRSVLELSPAHWSYASTGWSSLLWQELSSCSTAMDTAPRNRSIEAYRLL